MSQVEWAMWANEQGVVTSLVLLVSSIVGVAGMFKNWQIGIYGILLSLILLIVEWPRGKRIKGSTLERRFQRPFTVFLTKLRVVGRNYFIRFVLYLILCVPCCIILATLLGGVCLLCTSIIYFVAAIKGEEWKPTGLDEDSNINKKRAKSLHPPKKPPPRPNQQQEVDIATITTEIVEEKTMAGGGVRTGAKGGNLGKGGVAVHNVGGASDIQGDKAPQQRKPPSRPPPKHPESK